MISPWSLLACACALLVLPEVTPRRRLGRILKQMPSSAVRAPAASVRKLGRPLRARHLLALVCVGAFLATGRPLPAAAVLLLALTLDRRWRHQQTVRNTAAAGTEVVEGIDAVIAALRTGAHPAAAFAQAAPDCSATVGAAFTRAASRAQIGADIAAGFATEEAALPAMDRIGAAWHIAEKGGIALVDTLAAVRLDVVAEQQYRRRAQASLAGAKATAQVLALLPLLGIGLGQLMGATPLVFLFDTTTGGLLLLAGIVFTCAGMLWADAITAKAAR